MINFSFNLRNPFSNRWEIIKCLSGSFSKNKHWEIQTNKTSDVVSCDFRYTIRQDHAGLFLSFGLIGYEIIFNIYDSRHWNDDENRWYVYDNKGQSH